MSKIKNFFLPAVFSASLFFGDVGVANAQRSRVDTSIRTDFGDLDLKGLNFSNKTLLIYFGTAYKTPSCESFLDDAHIALNALGNSCPDVQAVFIYPGTQKTIDQFQDEPKYFEANIQAARRAGFWLIEGSRRQVEALARKYKFYFYEPDKYGDFQSHDRKGYLQGADGRNRLVFVNAGSGSAYPIEVSSTLSKALGCN